MTLYYLPIIYDRSRFSTIPSSAHTQVKSTEMWLKFSLLTSCLFVYSLTVHTKPFSQHATTIYPVLSTDTSFTGTPSNAFTFTLLFPVKSEYITHPSFVPRHKISSPTHEEVILREDKALINFPYKY